MSSRVVIEADGGSRGNPGPAGAGALVRDADSGAVLAERSVPLGWATNNHAEYRGLIEGLAAAADLGARVAEVRMDSKLVVEQMSGRWRIKHENLQQLAVEARQLLDRYDEVRLEWVPRADNADADRLANRAMDEQERGGSDPAPEPTPETGQDPAAQDATSTPTTSAGSWLGAVGAPTRLLLLRHGQTAMSVDKRYSGRGDVELTALGAQQAAAAAKRLAAEAEVLGAEQPLPVICSPLARARQTAQAVVEATGGQLETDDGLLETDFGGWEGLTFGEAAAQYPQLHRGWLGDPSAEPPGGESLEAVHERVGVACGRLLERYAGRTLVLVSHVTPIKSVLRTALDAGPSVFYRLHLDLASLSVAEFYPDGNASVRLVNDTTHCP
ncbi:bifunctional RNase H/acid phosphatase [Saccharopolyspora sp. HNM0983]|uniref:Bifunctional RNase H/acid phosphatase n=1 Tax=Saccharopolyspora montiporae TaxID=2781240 RepID=A0A929B7H2_9PSEU|nr:bifunctional RNase H/acid phosphatase [Saccharopolyspora sp. HNM0983]